MARRSSIRDSPVTGALIHPLPARALAPLGLLACTGHAPEPGWRTYTRALAELHSGDVATGRATCRSLEDGALRSDCRLEAARLDPAGAECATLSREVAQAECWFVQSEAAADEARWDAALDACARTGPFLRQCTEHLWTRTAQAQRATLESPVEMAVASEEAYRRLVPPEHQTPQASERWRRVLVDHFNHHKPLDARFCPTLPDSAQRPCAEAAAFILVTRHFPVVSASGNPADRARCPDLLAAIGQVEAGEPVEVPRFAQRLGPDSLPELRRLYRRGCDETR